MKVVGWLLGIAKGLFPAGHAWAVDIIAGLTHGTIRGVVEARNQPRGVRVYGATPERIGEIREKVQRFRAARAERDRVERGG